MKLQFDRYQRLKAVADIIGAVDAPRGPVLDVGGNPGELATFLPKRSVVVLDPDAGAGMVAGKARALPFKPGSFSAVVSVDTLEHVPAHSRFDTIREMAGASSDLLVLACPIDAEATRMAEDIVDRFHLFLHGREHPWLREHRRWGLPKRAEIERALSSLGLRFEVVPNGYLRNWLAMMLLNRWLETIPGQKGLLRAVNSVYNSTFYWRDWRFPCYRLFFVATKGRRDLTLLRKLGGKVGSQPRWECLAAKAGMAPARRGLTTSVVVVTHTGGSALRRCLRSLEKSSVHPAEILLVENGPPCVGSIASSIPVTVVNVGAPVSLAGANNLALSKAKGEMLFLLNDHACVHPDCLAELARVMELDQKLAVVGCKIYYTGSRVLQHAGSEILANGGSKHIGRGEVDHGQYDVPREVASVAGTAMAVRRRALERIGPLDEGYYPRCYEETDLCFRARLLGYRVLYLPTAVAYCDDVSATTELPESFFVWYHRNRLRFVVKNLDRHHLAGFLKHEFLMLMGRNHPLERIGLRRAYLSLAGMLPCWLATRARLRLPSHRNARPGRLKGGF